MRRADRAAQGRGRASAGWAAASGWARRGRGSGNGVGGGPAACGPGSAGARAGERRVGRGVGVGAARTGSGGAKTERRRGVGGRARALYARLVFTATFFAGAFQAALGLLRLGFLVDFLSHAAIVGFLAGCATVVCLGQLRGFLGLPHFTHHTGLPAIVASIFSQTAQWHWQPFLLGCCLFLFLQITRYVGKRRPKLFWVSAAAPLVSVILSTVLVYIIHGEKHGIQSIGSIKKGINPPSIRSLLFSSPHTWLAAKTGIITGIISLAEGSAVARSFAMAKDYRVDGNKEMIAFGAMNMAGSCASCYLTAGPFSRSAVNRDAGCRTAASNAVMALAVLATLLVLTPLFHHTPQVALSAIIASAMLGVVDPRAAARLARVDKVDFCVCLGTFLGVVFASVDVGLVVAVAVLVLRILLSVARPRTTALGGCRAPPPMPSPPSPFSVHAVTAFAAAVGHAPHPCCAPALSAPVPP
ncbi:sulfate transporter 3.2-like [Panicum virgatum]|uniref:sulfate transporter 3.2-like n=1 Tax=Panicum virgatum TaxID=38727 RepID=UPI0019D6505A|nr:sulfate transporter 3.2-like [Panicum virgatum]